LFDLPNRQDKDYMDYLDTMFKDLDKNGMMYPILYTDLEHYWLKEKRWPKDTQGNYLPGIGVHTGNKRVRWAKENNYDFIESYIVTCREQKDAIVTHTFLPRGQWPGQVSK